MNKTFIFLLLLLMTMTACATGNNGQGQQPFAAEDFTNNNNNVSTPETVSFREGDMTDIADRNPNFLDLNTENEAHNNHGFYQQKVRDIVDNSQMFEPGMIYVNGQNIVVNVTPSKKLSKDDIRRYKNGLHDRIKEAVPRYDIDIKVNDR